MVSRKWTRREAEKRLPIVSYKYLPLDGGIEEVKE